MKKLTLIMMLASPVMNAGVVKLAAKGTEKSVVFAAKAVKKTAKVVYKIAY